MWESKVDLYKRWGWSEGKIMAAMDFFVNKMGLESSFIAKHPVFITLSLQKRLIPRAEVFPFLLTKRLIKKSKHTNLVALFKSTEKAFLEKFVNSYDEAPQLLKLYQEKLDLSKITK
ncbi:hypothetical protein LWI28_005035 [Acer negundo]|uniref:Uncharacterized protein n=1 Tax=Acer negundo TaxID=4023 RepID=A0AAD5NX26_ACENE|nr:hypothetical protein LWI28_005035 [Acer negundo]